MVGIAFILLFAFQKAEARMAKVEDAGFVFEERTVSVEVARDGSMDLRYLEILEVLKEGRKQEIGTRRLPYNSRTSVLRVVRAEVWNGRDHRKVDPKFIEDKPLVSPEQGFDERSQVTVAFPDVRQGSRLFLEYKMKVKEVPFEGHFSDRYFFGAGFFQKAGKVVIRSALPLQVEKNDPSSVLEIAQRSLGSDQETRIELKRPFYFDAVNEYKPHFGADDLTWVAVSSDSDYSALAKKVTGPYEEVVSAALPDSFERIRIEAAKETDSVSQINRVTSMLADQVRYNGDWRPIRGGHVPRSLHLIDQTRFGDCKDFAASTVAILRKLGFAGNVAWIERDIKPDSMPRIALSGVFNHAIAWAKRDGRTFWVDPTNLQSFAQGIFEDINERRALVLDPVNPRWETVSGGDSSASQAIERRKVEFLKEGRSRVVSNIELKGRAAVEMSGASLRVSKDMIDYRFATALTKESDIISFDVKSDDLSSRVVKDLRFRVAVEEKRSSDLTTAGRLFRTSPLNEMTDLMTIDRKDRVSGFFLGHPKVSRREVLLENVELVGKAPKPCRIDTPWASVVRAFSPTVIGIRMVDEVRIEKLQLSNAEVLSPAFAKFQTDLKSCYDLAGVVFLQKRLTRGTAASGSHL